MLRNKHHVDEGTGGVMKMHLEFFNVKFRRILPGASGSGLLNNIQNAIPLLSRNKVETSIELNSQPLLSLSLSPSQLAV